MTYSLFLQSSTAFEVGCKRDIVPLMYRSTIKSHLWYEQQIRVTPKKEIFLHMQISLKIISRTWYILDWICINPFQLQKCTVSLVTSCIPAAFCNAEAWPSWLLWWLPQSDTSSQMSCGRTLSDGLSKPKTKIILMSALFHNNHSTICVLVFIQSP